MRLLRAVHRDPAVSAYADDLEPPLAQLTRSLIALVRTTVPRSGEVMHHGSPKFCLDHVVFAYVSAHADHVNLGFFAGAHLPDPGGLLEGTGKALRHVKLSPAERFSRPALVKLLRAAMKRARAEAR